MCWNQCQLGTEQVIRSKEAWQYVGACILVLPEHTSNDVLLQLALEMYSFRTWLAFDLYDISYVNDLTLRVWNLTLDALNTKSGLTHDRYYSKLCI